MCSGRRQRGVSEALISQQSIIPLRGELKQTRTFRGKSNIEWLSRVVYILVIDIAGGVSQRLG